MLLFGDVKTGGMSRQEAHRGALNPVPVVGTLGAGEDVQSSAALTEGRGSGKRHAFTGSQ